MSSIHTPESVQDIAHEPEGDDEHVEHVDHTEAAEQAEQRAILDDPAHMRHVEIAKLELYVHKQTGVLKRMIKELAKRHEDLVTEYENGSMRHLGEDIDKLRAAAANLVSVAGEFL